MSRLRRHLHGVDLRRALLRLGRLASSFWRSAADADFCGCRVVPQNPSFLLVHLGQGRNLKISQGRKLVVPLLGESGLKHAANPCKPPLTISQSQTIYLPIPIHAHVYIYTYLSIFTVFSPKAERSDGPIFGSPDVSWPGARADIATAARASAGRLAARRAVEEPGCPVGATVLHHAGQIRRMRIRVGVTVIMILITVAITQ